jgi:hypothetical protein
MKEKEKKDNKTKFKNIDIPHGATKLSVIYESSQIIVRFNNGSSFDLDNSGGGDCYVFDI